jgi:SAM-dependent methyltransferase
VAGQYDEHVAASTAVLAEHLLVERYLTQPGVVVDLGCGTGRVLLPLAARGFFAIGVDLSPAMLGRLRRQAAKQHLAVDCLQANLVQLDCLVDAVADYALCLFSTLGMIRGDVHRQQFLQHVRRILKPGGLFLVHAHNLWHSASIAGGRWRLVGQLAAALLRRDRQLGDVYDAYQRIPAMYLHLFRRRELLAALGSAGFTRCELVPLDYHRGGPLGGVAAYLPWRPGGWLAVCR